jgi:hypothetical protein
LIGCPAVAILDGGKDACHVFHRMADSGRSVVLEARHRAASHGDVRF